jgi:RNA polymerase sigma factor (sigma-70 family)
VPAEGLAGIAGDPAAFEAFYRRHVTAITRFLARRVADPELVADLVADVFYAVIESAHSYQPDRGTELGWLYGIARNVLAGDRRRAALRLRAEGLAAGRRLLDDDDIARLEERIDAESAARHLWQVLAVLPADERAVLELVVVDGLALKDAAAVLGIRPGTARVRMYRARRAARGLLDPGGPPGTQPAPAAVRVMSATNREQSS